MDLFAKENRATQSLDEESKQATLSLINSTADPQSATHNLEDFIQNNDDLIPHIQKCLQHPRSRRQLILALGNSPYLANVLRRWPACLPTPDETALDIHEGNRILQEKLLKTTDWSEAARLLRIHKHHCYFHIGSRDLSGEYSLIEVVRAISTLADGCLEAGYQWLTQQLNKRYGHPLVLSAQGEKHPARFVVMGMGKLGARELNFSSDVDLIYLFDAEDGEVEGSCSLHLKGYFNRLGKELIQLLGKSTAEGHVFRIDLRLRPEGESGDLSLSCYAAELYYESWGQTWERSAMIKARPVAGDLALGETFLDGLKPFVFRRYLDFGALEAIREMKRKIDQKMASAEDYHHNVKLGFGGIREIEFFVQSQQLIHGGKDTSLRHRETLVTLNNLCSAGWLRRETALFLAEAYHFLRTVEHRLQIKHDQQLHSIPDDANAFARLSKRMGITNPEHLQQRLQEVRSKVHAIYQELFFEADNSHKEAHHPQIEALLACSPADETCRQLLKESGFNHLEQAGSLIGILRDGPQRLALTEGMRCWYRRIASPLLQEILKAPDQDMAIQHAESFLGILGHRVNYLALLLENPSVLSILVRLFGTSVLLSRFFIKNPELMDRLVTQDFLQHYRNRSELAADLAAFLKDEPDVETRFNMIREFKNSETLRLGVRDLSKTAELTEVMSGLSALADVILSRVMEDAMLELIKRYGEPRVPFVILAMGKLGGRELNYASDLDLIFLHGGQGDQQETNGDNPIPITVFFTRLGQKIITGITTLTRSGILYELDMRLRPSGNSGALVTSIEAFLRYQKHEAWVWEHQALTRSRVVAGDPTLANHLHQQLRSIIQQTREINTLRQEVQSMRLRMFQEKQPQKEWLDIKQSRGGIVDIEFLSQFLILAFANQFPEIIQINTAKVLRVCHQVGLLEKQAYTTLESAYEFMRLVENRLRLLHGRSENRIGPSPVVREQLRRLCDLPENRDIVSVLHDHFQAVFPIVQHYLEGNAPSLPENP